MVEVLKSHDVTAAVGTEVGVPHEVEQGQVHEGGYLVPFKVSEREWDQGKYKSSEEEEWEEQNVLGVSVKVDVWIQV